MVQDRTTLAADAFAPPPRFLPLSVRLHFYFGGCWNQIGWALFGFGMFFVWVFVPNADVTSLIDFNGTLERAKGKVTAVEETNFLQGRRGRMVVRLDNRPRRNRKPIHAVHFRFVDGGLTFGNVSYGVMPDVEGGKPVDVEFPAGDPLHSRIVGMRTQPFGWWAIFVSVFPLAGFAMVVSGLRFGHKAARLLRDGMTAEATLVDKKETGGRVNRMPVYELHFEFTAGDGKQYRTSVKTHHMERFTGEPETLLYDPSNPSYALPVDALPLRPQFDAFGEITPRSALSSFFVTLLPAIAVANNLVVAILAFNA